MKAFLKEELKGWAQYFALALMAGWLHFAYEFGSIPGINIKEAWRNYEPLLRQWLFIFSALSLVRLLILLAVRKLARRI